MPPIKEKIRKIAINNQHYVTAFDRTLAIYLLYVLEEVVVGEIQARRDKERAYQSM